MPLLLTEQKQIQDLRCQRASGEISERDLVQKWTAIEDASEPLGWLAEHRHDELTRRLRRQYSGKLLLLKAITWNAQPGENGCTFLPDSCGNLSTFLKKGRILFKHVDCYPVARPVAVRSDDYGLWVWGEVLPRKSARLIHADVRSSMKSGVPLEASIMLDLERLEGHRDVIDGVNVVSRFRLAPLSSPEISIVAESANHETQVKAF
jgi:hypothetical protein